MLSDVSTTGNVVDVVPIFTEIISRRFGWLSGSFSTLSSEWWLPDPWPVSGGDLLRVPHAFGKLVCWLLSFPLVEVVRLG